MIDWLNPIGEWFGVSPQHIALLLFLILICLIIGLIRG